MDVRLNTNESPYRPPPAWVGAVVAELERHRLPPLPRPPGCAGCGRASPRSTACGRAGLRGQRLQRGPPDASSSPTAAPAAPRRCSSPPTPCTATIAHLTATAVARGSGTRLPTRSDEVKRVVAESAPTSRSCARPTTRRAAPSRRTASTRSSQLAPGLVVVDEAYGQFARGRRSTWSPTTGRSWSPGPTPRRGRWPGPGSATSSGRRRSWPRSSRRRCRTTSTR